MSVFSNGRSQQTGGSRIDYSGTDNTWESIQSVINGASSSMRINNTSASNGDPGSNSIANTNKLTIGGTDSGSALMDGYIFEGS